MHHGNHCYKWQNQLLWTEPHLEDYDFCLCLRNLKTLYLFVPQAHAGREERQPLCWECERQQLALETPEML